MIRFALRGFLHPGPSRPTFVIPFFGTADGSTVFVQELDEHHRIVSFLRFEPSIFENYTGAIPVLEASVGDDGVVGFLDDKGKLHSGTAAELRHLLASYRFADDGSDAFFATEVMDFRSDEAGFARAIEAAAQRFDDTGRGMRWKAREFSARQPLRGDPKPSGNDIGSLLSDLARAAHGRWLELFVEAWRRHGPSEALFAAALEWLHDGNLHHYQAGKVLGLLLPAKRRLSVLTIAPSPSLPVVARLAMRWLEELQHPGLHWAIVWLRLWDGRFFAESALIPIARRYLETEDHIFARTGGTGPRNGWLRIWRAIWIESHEGERSDLISLLEQRGDQLGRNSELGDLLLLVSEDPEHRSWALGHLEAWLLASSRQTRNWAGVCSKVLSRYPHDPVFEKIALDWLEGDGAEVGGWYRVWAAVRHQSGAHAFDVVAYDWLVRGRITMRVWPDVLASFLDYSRVDHDRRLSDLAEQWLQLGKPHAQRDRIEGFVRSQLDEPDRSLRRRIYVCLTHSVDSWRASQVRRILSRNQGFYEVPHMEPASWRLLTQAGPEAVQTFIDNQLRSASVTLVLFGAETDARAVSDYEILRSHELGLGMLAIDIHRLPGPDGASGLPGRNPLLAWQQGIGDMLTPFSRLYPSYDWVEDDGAANIGEWIRGAAIEAADRRRKVAATSHAELT